MPNEVTVGRLRELLQGSDVRLLEVLPQNEYDEEHLPGAINIPLKSLTRDEVARFDKSRPTVVYCWDDL